MTPGVPGGLPELGRDPGIGEEEPGVRCVAKRMASPRGASSRLRSHTQPLPSKSDRSGSKISETKSRHRCHSRDRPSARTASEPRASAWRRGWPGLPPPPLPTERRPHGAAHLGAEPRPCRLPPGETLTLLRSRPRTVSNKMQRAARGSHARDSSRGAQWCQPPPRPRRFKSLSCN